MERSIEFSEEHIILRESLQKFLENEIGDQYEQWEKDGIVPREIWKKCGENGYLLPWVEEKYGGAGGDFLFSVIIAEEIIKFGAGSLFVPVHNDVVAPYIHSFGSEEQKEKWLPGCVTGDSILAVAMTEPEAGSDLASMKSTAVVSWWSFGFII